MELTNSNYFSREAAMEYWSVSQFKTFNKCEAAGLAEARGEYVREESDALLIGGYVDAYFAGELSEYSEAHREQMINKRTGGLLAKFDRASDLIDRIEADPLMVEYMSGKQQVIKTAELFGVPWKIKMDFYDPYKIVDLKVVKDFENIYDKGYGWRSWIEYWGYDVQGAIYQKIEQLATGRVGKLDFYIAAITKEKTPDIKLIEIPQHVLDAALAMVEAKIERFDLIKTGQVDPIRCEKCDYCKATKVLRSPEVYEIEEA